MITPNKTEVLHSFTNRHGSMTDQISFNDDISSLENALEAARADLAELEKRSQKYDLKTQEARDALNKLRSALRGELPAPKSRNAAGSIHSLELNDESGRPARGARRKQIEAICHKLGKSNRPFQTVDVLNILREVEDELSEGMKSYTYAVMNTLKDKNIVTKIGRGKWRLSR